MDGERQNIRKLLALIQIRAKRGEREFDGLVESLRINTGTRGKPRRA
jgi:hypothetical protein